MPTFSRYDPDPVWGDVQGLGTTDYVNTVAPSVSGTVQVGDVLTGSVGTWSPAPSGFRYVWERSSDGGVTWSISPTNANQTTYTIQAADQGYEILFHVVPLDSQGNPLWGQSANAAATAAVTPSGGSGTFTPNTAAPAQTGPWLAVSSPWRTPIPINAAISKTGLDYTNYIHPDSMGMVQDVYLGHDYSPAPDFDIHSWAYDQADNTTKYGASGPTLMKWLGPGGWENIVYAKSTDPFITVVNIGGGANVSCPLPSNWTGYNVSSQSSKERRTIIVCDDGRAWVLYKVTPPSENGTSNWQCSDGQQVGNWDTSAVFYWGGGGSGIAHGNGLIMPSDIAYARVNGDFGHALCLNWTSSADGSYTSPNPHPKAVWPSGKGYAGAPEGPNTDGRTKTIAGIPYGARVFLNPSLSDTDLANLGLVHKSPDDWTYWLAHTAQRYGFMAKEANTGQGGAGGIMHETVESVAWNAAHGVPGYSGFEWPWAKDGTVDNVDDDNSTFNAAFPPSLVPQSGSNWMVFDWTKDYPGITAVT